MKHHSHRLDGVLLSQHPLHTQPSAPSSVKVSNLPPPPPTPQPQWFPKHFHSRGTKEKRTSTHALRAEEGSQKCCLDGLHFVKKESKVAPCFITCLFLFGYQKNGFMPHISVEQVFGKWWSFSLWHLRGPGYGHTSHSHTHPHPNSFPHPDPIHPLTLTHPPRRFEKYP